MNIAIAGKMRSGKTTLANMLVEREGYTCMPLAAPVKGVAAVICNRAIDYLYPATPLRRLSLEEIEAHKDVFRPLLQWVGTEFFREYLDNNNIWVDYLFQRMEEVDTPIVVDDVRFVNEAIALKERGFTIVKLIRTGEVDVPARSVERHVSETEVESIQADYTFECSDIDCLSEIAGVLAGIRV